MVDNRIKIYRGKRVLVTGHTGFKGSWLVFMLSNLGAKVGGISITQSDNVLFDVSTRDKLDFDIVADIRNRDLLEKHILEFNPDIVFHLAAQSLVIESYKSPYDTYSTNVMGTFNLLNACRQLSKDTSIVCVTTDKVYENKETTKPYNEEDNLGGYDLYSSSKACCEILVNSFRNSFFNLKDYEKHRTLISTARGGNVIGGGDWNENRLIPDLIKASRENKTTEIRNPSAVRPWQHVLDCLFGYLLLGEKLIQKDISYSGAWNFAPKYDSTSDVLSVVKSSQKVWNDISYQVKQNQNDFHESNLLVLDNSKATELLQWDPKLDIQESIKYTIDWYKEYFINKRDLMDFQINQYLNKS